MRSNYLIYPDTLLKLKESGIEARVNDLKKSEDGLPFMGGCTYSEDIIYSVKDLSKRGFYNNLPEDFAKEYHQTMNGILNNPNNFSWEIETPNGTITEPCDLKDLLLFSGDLASMILKPEEIWDYSKFGFSSPSELITTVGAFIIQQSKGSGLSKGYKWTTKWPNGSKIINFITGSTHADLRIFQTDTTPYSTVDPFGNTIGIRPEINYGQNIIAPFHSTEGTLLVAVIKYIEEQGIETEFLKDDAKELIEWGRSLGQTGGFCAEHLGGYDSEPMLFFIGYDLPLPQLNESNETDKKSNFWLVNTHDSGYEVLIANNGDFVLSFHDTNLLNSSVKPISARFLPEDAEHLVKGLIYQSANGLGRTSAKQLIDILEYKYSPKFEEDQEKYKF